MKKLVLLFLSSWMVVMLQGQISITADVKNPGTLFRLLPDVERAKLSDLTITGTIDSTDFITIRDSLPSLATLDMNKATVKNNAITAGALYKKRSLTSVVIPTSLTSINDSAFSQCTGLKGISIPMSVKYIGNRAFENNDALLQIDVYWSSPIDLSNMIDVFKNVNVETCKLIVPYKSATLYQRALVWGDFKMISERPFLSFETSKISIESINPPTDSVYITSNIPWQVFSKQSWLTIHPKTGEGSQWLYLNAMSNQGYSNRVGTVTIMGNNVSSKNLTVTQAAKNVVIHEKKAEGCGKYVNGTDTIYTSGLYKDTTIGTVSDTINSLFVVIHPEYVITIVDTINYGETYLLGNKKLNTSGNYTYTFTTLLGCDSIVNLALTIKPKPVVQVGIDSTVCGSFDFMGNTITKSGTYLDTIVNPSVDTIIKLGLTVNRVYHDTIIKYLSFGKVFTFDNIKFNKSTVYTQYSKTTAGCDSSTTLNLTVLPRGTKLTELSISECGYFIIDNDSVTKNGLYVRTLKAVSGVDSVVVINLTIHPVYQASRIDTLERTTTHTTIYLGDSIFIKTKVVDQSFTPTDSLKSINGCDSLVKVEVTWKEILVNKIEVHRNARACESYMFDNEAVSKSGVYTHTYKTTSGIDSTIIVNVTILPSYHIEKTSESNSTNIVASRPALWNDSTVNLATDSLATGLGCDSIITTRHISHVFYVWKTNVELFDTACGMFSFGGKEITTSGTYTDTTNVTDTTFTVTTLHLVINPVYDIVKPVELAYGSKYMLGDTTLATSGTYTRTLTSQNGCDSTVTLRVSVLLKPVVIDTLTISTCNKFSFRDKDYVESGVYTDTLKSEKVDSITLIYLTIYYKDIIKNIITVIEKKEYEDSPVYSSPEAKLLRSDTLIKRTLVTETNSIGCDSTTQFDTIYITNTYSIPVIKNMQRVEACDSFAFNGVILRNSGTYSDTTKVIKNEIPQITINSIDLLINKSVQTYSSETITTYIYVEDDGTINKDTLFRSRIDSMITVNHFTGTNGCDSTHFSTLVEIYHTLIKYHTIDSSVTACNSFMFGGKLLTESGLYSDTIKLIRHDTLPFNDTLPRYDSISAIEKTVIINLSLTIKKSANKTVYKEINYDKTYDFYGTLLYKSGTYVHVFPVTTGCDSTETLVLTVIPKPSVKIYETACGSFVFNGITYTMSGEYIQTDSTDAVDTILFLTVNPVYKISVSKTIAFGTTYTFGKTKITKNGTYTYTFKTVSGCDSTVTLTMTVLPHGTILTELNQTACNYYMFGPDTLRISGSYTRQLITSSGVDSVVVLNLTVYPRYEIIKSEFLMSLNVKYTSTPISWDDISTLKPDTTASYIDELVDVDSTLRVTSHGCDSLEISNVYKRIYQNHYYVREMIVSTCDSYMYGDKELKESGTFVDTTEYNGCWVISTLHLDVHRSINTKIYREIAYGDSLDFYGKKLWTSGTYTYTQRGTSGCDSSVTLVLTVLPKQEVPIYVTACGSYTFQGDTYYTTGVYRSRNVNVDTILHLTINPVFHSFESKIIAFGSSYTFGGIKYTKTGDYTHKFRSTSGCDSVVDLSLTVLSRGSKLTNQSATACGSYPFDKDTLYHTGTYTSWLKTTTGTDSVVVLDLTIFNTYKTAVSKTIAFGSTYTLGDTILKDSGTYTRTLRSIMDCDSIVTLTLNVTQQSDSISVAFFPTVYAGSSPLVVNFMDYSHYNLPISGWEWDFDGDNIIDSYKQNPSWTYTKPGTYSVSLSVWADLISKKLTKSNLITVTDNIPNSVLEVSTLQLSPNKSGDTMIVAIRSNIAWNISSFDPWISLSKMYGQENDSVMIIINPNPAISTRSGMITVSGYGVQPRVINVSQSSGDPQLSVNPDTISVDMYGISQIALSVTSNIDWTIESDQPWVHFSKTSGTGYDFLGVYADENLSSTNRVARVRINSSYNYGQTDSLIVIQQGSQGSQNYLNVSTNNVTVTNETFIVNIETNTLWYTSLNHYEWLNLSAYSGSGSYSEFKINVKPNITGVPRTDTITINGVGVKAQKIVVTQLPMAPQPDPVFTSLNVPSGMQGKTIELVANVKYLNAKYISFYLTNDSSYIYVNQTRVPDSTHITGYLDIPPYAKLGMYKVCIGYFDTLKYEYRKISLDSAFEVQENPMKPVLRGISPMEGKQNSQLTVTISGEHMNFSPGQRIYVSFEQASSSIVSKTVNVIDSNTLSAELYLPSSTSTGTYDLIIYAFDTLKIYPNRYFLSNAFTVREGKKSIIEGVTPSVGMIGTELTVSLSMMNYEFNQASSTVYLLNQEYNNYYPSSSILSQGNTLIVTIPVPQNAPEGMYDVALVNDIMGTPIVYSNAITLKRNVLAPIITKVSPSSCVQGERLLVTISGQNVDFTQSTSTVVTFNSMYDPTQFIQATTTITSPTTLDAEVSFPENASIGGYNVNVMTNNGMLTAYNGFTVTAGQFAPTFMYESTMKNDSLRVTITSNNFNFEQATGTLKISLQSGSYEEMARELKNVNDTAIEVLFLDVPYLTSPHIFDIVVSQYSYPSVKVLHVFENAVTLDGVHTKDTNITLGTTKVQFATSAGGSIPVAVWSNAALTASSNQQWLNPRVARDSIILTADRNMTFEARTAIVSVTATGGSPRYIIVYQPASDTTTIVGTREVTLGNDTTPASIELISNTTPVATSNQNWLTVSIVDGKATFVATPNTTFEPRTGTVTITSPGTDPITITITQKASLPTLQISDTLVTFETDSMKAITIDVTSNSAWTASVDDSWLKLVSSAGSLTFTPSANTSLQTRTVDVTISVPGLSPRVVKVIQHGAKPFISLSSVAISVANDSVQPDTIHVTSNVTWMANSNRDWLTATVDNGKIIVKATNNTSLEPRIAKVTVYGMGATSQEAIITQAPADVILTVSTTKATFDNDTIVPVTIMVTSNTLWTAEIDQNWLSITVGNDKVIITADANTTSTTRSATITISATGTANQVVNVSQTGSTPFLKLDTTIVKFDKNDVLTKTVNVTSNGIFTALSDKDWVTVLVNGKTLIISASKNDGDSSRTATITVQTPGVAPRTITVTQSATKTSADDVPVVVLEVFPNPTTESFAITGFEGVATVMLGSVTKPEIFKTRVSAGECIDVSSLAQGEYVVRIYTANTLLVTKLIKQ